MLDTHARKYTDGLFHKLAGGFLRLGLQPNHITAAAFPFCTRDTRSRRRDCCGCPGCWMQRTAKWPAFRVKAACTVRCWIS